MTGRPFRGVFLALLVLLACRPAFAARVIVTVDGVRSNRGQVMVAIFAQAEHFPDGDYAESWAKKPATTAPLTFVFDGLPPGRYALGAYHDENGNGKLDTNLIGWPTEGYALSNGIRLTYYRPRFDESAFTVQGDTAVQLHIGY